MTATPPAAAHSTVLVVDDEIGYCEKISRYLAGRGYAVITATSGREAILLGGVHRPTVLITDWMLRDEVHGLHVVDTIRSVYPDTRAVVMTGFASGDLRLEAKVREVCAFVEKPFAPDLLAAAVEEVIDARAPRPAYPTFAFLRTDAAGAVTDLNGAARALLAPGGEAVEGRSVHTLFTGHQPFILDHAAMRWVGDLHPVARPELACIARARRLLDGSYFVIVGDKNEATLLEYHSAVGLLLDLPGSGPSLRSLVGHGIVVDPDIASRTLVACVFEELASICHAADTLARGLELLTLDADVRYVVVDPTAAGDLARFMELARELRPDVKILGHAERARILTLEDIGLDHVITKPWNVSDFVDLLVDTR